MNTYNFSYLSDDGDLLISITVKAESESKAFVLASDLLGSFYWNEGISSMKIDCILADDSSDS